MRLNTIRRRIVLGFFVIATCGVVGPASADFIPAEIEQIPSNIPAFIQEFRAFLSDFPRWDAAHLELPLVALAMTPEQDRPAMLLVLWDLWMNDHSNTSTGLLIIPRVVYVQETSPPGGNGVPGTGDGSGTISSTPGDGGGSGGPTNNAPEPSSAALITCGSLTLLACRLLRRRGASRATKPDGIA